MRSVFMQVFVSCFWKRANTCLLPVYSRSAHILNHPSFPSSLVASLPPLSVVTSHPTYFSPYLVNSSINYITLVCIYFCPVVHNNGINRVFRRGHFAFCWFHSRCCSQSCKHNKPNSKCQWNQKVYLKCRDLLCYYLYQTISKLGIWKKNDHHFTGRCHLDLFWKNNCSLITRSLGLNEYKCNP